jgi:hypothetical protein
LRVDFAYYRIFDQISPLGRNIFHTRRFGVRDATTGYSKIISTLKMARQRCLSMYLLAAIEIRSVEPAEHMKHQIIHI